MSTMTGLYDTGTELTGGKVFASKCRVNFEHEGSTGGSEKVGGNAKHMNWSGNPFNRISVYFSLLCFG